MSVNNTGYKRQIRAARCRLLGEGYQQMQDLNVSAISGKAFFLNSRIVCGEELYEYYKQVSMLILNGKVENAIGELIDQSLYQSMTREQQEKYVFALAFMFRELKREYEKRTR